jgi:Chlorophyll A-B binding protein
MVQLSTILLNDLKVRQVEAGATSITFLLRPRPSKRFEEFTLRFIRTGHPPALPTWYCTRSTSKVSLILHLQFAAVMMSCRSILPLLGFALFAEGFVSDFGPGSLQFTGTAASSPPPRRRRSGTMTQMPVSSSRGPTESLNPADEPPPTTSDSPSSVGTPPAVSPPPPARRKGTVMSQALPFLRCPEPLVNCDYAGNAGFDPLGLASSAEQLAEYREAEVKHARLAMLVRDGVVTRSRTI